MKIDTAKLPALCYLKKGVFFIISERHVIEAGWSPWVEVAMYDNGPEAAEELERLYHSSKRRKKTNQYSMRCSIFT